ncbi:hypothetical protein PI124_g22090 [Phytophthora idaei]|nr:hypothetical protein PI124_g22090 [Phytophthora idaei]
MQFFGVRIVKSTQIRRRARKWKRADVPARKTNVPSNLPSERDITSLYIPAFPPQQHDDKSQRVPEISRDVCAARTAFATPAPGQLDAAQVRSACTAPNTKKAYRSYIKGIAAWIHTTFPAA